MSKLMIAGAVALASGFFAVAYGGRAEARIMCDGNFQLVRGQQPVVSLYCREQELARVARGYGWRITAAEIRASESKKADVCRAIGYDNRVRETCDLYRSDGGGRLDP